jgi:hypothetical protein
MAQISCSICLEDLPLTEFRFYSCGTCCVRFRLCSIPRLRVARFVRYVERALTWLSSSGHGWCQGCISRLQPRKPCPHCKRPLGGEKPHPIFPNITNIASDDRTSEAGSSSGKAKEKADPVQVLIDEVQSDISVSIDSRSPCVR